MCSFGKGNKDTIEIIYPAWVSIFKEYLDKEVSVFIIFAFQ